MFNSLHQAKESTITNRIMKYLKTQPGFAWKQAGGIYGTAGLPDIIYIKEQKRAIRAGEGDDNKIYYIRYPLVFGFEVKRQSRKKQIPLDDQPARKQKDATDIQEEMMKQMEAAGAMCYVVYSRQEVQKILEG